MEWLIAISSLTLHALSFAYIFLAKFYPEPPTQATYDWRQDGRQTMQQIMRHYRSKLQLKQAEFDWRQEGF